MEITIKIKDANKAKGIFDLLNELPFVEIKILKKRNSFQNFEDLFGIWKDRDVSAAILRKKAWREDASL